MTIPTWLIHPLDIPETCISRKSSAQENARSFVIQPQSEDQIWRVQVDGCWLDGNTTKKVDYIFWVQSASGKQLVLLVELKGKNFGHALKQIESTLRDLCEQANGQDLHARLQGVAPGHEPIANGGARAYVILSKGKGVPLRQRELEQIRQRYGVRVYAKSHRLEVKGIAALP